VGYGIQVWGGTSLVAEACEVRGNTSRGLIALDSGTSVTLRETSIEDTKPDESGGGDGIQVSDGASLHAEACMVRRNTSAGVIATQSGTSVTLRESAIEDTLPNEYEEDGFGIVVRAGASLDTENCQIGGNTSVGVLALDSGTSVTLRGTSIEDTRPNGNEEGGFGIQVTGGANLDAEGCEVRGNTGAGVSASDTGTSVTLRETRIDSTMPGELQTVGIGVVAQLSASIVATGIEVSSNEGPGFYIAGEDAHSSCSGCVIQDNQFAGAVATIKASLQLADSFIEGTTEQENIGGGVGIFTDSSQGGPPILSVSNTTIQDNPIAGVLLSGEGSYSLTDNTIHGGEGWTRESLNKCGDAVYAGDGVTTWDGSSGLLLENNELLDSLGAGLFLENASATLNGNSYVDNAVDIVSQGADCATPPAGYENEALGSAELCPTYDYATCGDDFTLYLELVEPETGHGATFMRPGLPCPSTLHHSALPVAPPLAYDLTRL